MFLVATEYQLYLCYFKSEVWSIPFRFCLAIAHGCNILNYLISNLTIVSKWHDYFSEILKPLF